MTDAVIVGSGPNGLAAAVTLAEAGREVVVLEAKDTIGGGTRTAELTLPGFRHDVCSAVHPLGVGSPFFRTRDLTTEGLRWIQPEIPVAHPLDDGGVSLRRRFDDMAAEIRGDATMWRSLLEPLARRWDQLADEILQPIVHRPRHLGPLVRFGLPALAPATTLAGRFDTPEARALVAGNAAHAVLPLDRWATASFALVMAITAHAVGWPVAAGGSQSIADALAARVRRLGGRIETGVEVRRWSDLPEARAVLFDTTPSALARIAGDRLPDRYRRRLLRFRHGPGVFKLDLALDDAVPWRHEGARRAGTIHVGGTLEEIAAAEAAVWRGEHPERPFVLVAQPTIVDPSRAPAGRHVLWAYTHVPHGSTVDMTERIEAQIERFAPGFRDRILARHAKGPADLERDNPNLVGGDITGGSHGGLQLFFRPTVSPLPYRTPTEGIYLCSASTPPGAGVHGMCGYNAARAVLRRELR